MDKSSVVNELFPDLIYVTDEINYFGFFPDDRQHLW